MWDIGLLLQGLALFAVSCLFPWIASHEDNAHLRALLCTADALTTVASIILVAKSFPSDGWGYFWTIVGYIFFSSIYSSIVMAEEGYVNPYTRRPRKKD